MSKAVEGAAMLGAAAGLGAAMFFTAGAGSFMFANPIFTKLLTGLVLGGISMEAGAIAEALTSNRGTNITTRQAASFRQVVRGEQRIGGVEIYRNTTGGKHDQYNYVIALASHVIDSIVGLYLDGRKVFWNVGSVGNSTRNGVNFGGSAGGGAFIGPNGQHYNFDTLVYCEARYGDQAPGDVIGALSANDPAWVAGPSGAPYVGGCAYIYLKVEYDTAMFPGEPEIRITVRGKNDIYDPRSGTRGYTTNWALHVADAITDVNFGLGDVDGVNTAQLIAAANVCDEMVPLASGLTESRYALSWHYDTSVSPGDVLQQMMPGAAGRLSYIGGEWYIWPAYWQGPSFSFDESMLLAPPQWSSVRAYKDLINRVNGTYIAPNYPYNTAGNLYDSNGWFDGTIANTFPFAFQPTNFPMYAADVLHGYAADQYLAQDGGVQLPRELGLQTVLSIAQAQRIAKINLMRNRQQGTGMFTMGLAAWQMQPLSVMQFTMAAMSWTNKVLEIDNLRFRAEQEESEGQGEAAYRFFVEVSVIETDISVYEWSTTEELTVYDVPAKLTGGTYTPVPPTAMTVVSSAGTAVTGADGIVTPRAEITWSAPLDVLVTQIQVQYQANGAATWIDAGLVDVEIFQAFVSGVIAGEVYNFRIRSLRANGAASPWVEVDTVTISMTLSSIAADAITGLAPSATINALDASNISSGTLGMARLPGGLGSVSSVAVTVPSILTETGSPVTGAGTIALDVAMQPPNELLAGPASGANAKPAFRALVAADLPPTIAAKNYAGSGSATVAAGASAQVGAGASASVSGSALSGDVSLTTGTGTLAAGVLCTVTFPTPFASTPHGVCALNGAGNVGLSWSTSTTGLILSASVPLTPSAAYLFSYFMAG